MPVTRRTGRAAFLQLLIDEGVDHLFGNPGTTELPIMEAVSQFPQLNYVLGLQESIVLGMADGFARATRRLAACNLHCTPGLGHAMGALYSAKFSGSPLIVTAGQYELGHGLTEPLLYEPLLPIAAPLVKWAVEVERVQDLPRIVHRAGKVALSPPTGPVFISLPGSILDDEAELDLGSPTRVHTATRPGDEVLRALAQRMLAAASPVLLAGRELAEQDAFEEASELARLLGAGVYLESVACNTRFPAERALALGDIGRNQPKARAALQPHDLLICLGGDLLRMSPAHPVDPLPDGMPVIHLSERDWELGKNYPTEWAVRASVKETLRALLPVLRAARDAGYAAAARQRAAEIAARNWSARRRERVAALQGRADAAPIDQDYLMWRVSELLPPDVVIVEEMLTSAPAAAALLRTNDPTGYYGLASGGLGFGMAGAIGISLARPGRPVAALIGDGSAMYSIQALWTAAHLKLPITYLIVNNRGYRIIKDRLRAMRGTDRFVAMDLDDPPLDFVALATGMGVPARRIVEAAQIDDALRQAFSRGGPSLIEVVVDNGYPN